MSGALAACREALERDLDGYPVAELRALEHCLEGLRGSLSEVHGDVSDRQARQDLLAALIEALEGDE